MTKLLSTALAKTGLVRDNLDRVAAILNQQLSRFDPEFSHGFRWRSAGLFAKACKHPADSHSCEMIGIPDGTLADEFIH